MARGACLMPLWMLTDAPSVRASTARLARPTTKPAIVRTDSQTAMWELLKAGLGVGFAQQALVARTLGMVALLPEFRGPPLEVWLTARWGAHTRKAGRTWWVPNEHDAWPLQAAEIVELHDELVDAAGVQPVGDRLRGLYSRGIRTRFGRPCLVQ